METRLLSQEQGQPSLEGQQYFLMRIHKFVVQIPSAAQEPQDAQFKGPDLAEEIQRKTIGICETGA